MSTFKVTRKQVEDTFRTVLIIQKKGYMLTNQYQIAHGSGRVYGWNFSVFAYDGVALVHGDRCLPRGYRVSLELQATYEQKAREIINSFIGYKATKLALDANLYDFIVAALNEKHEQENKEEK